MDDIRLRGLASPRSPGAKRNDLHHFPYEEMVPAPFCKQEADSQLRGELREVERQTHQSNRKVENQKSQDRSFEEES